ncbi:hypothetical protein HUN08_16875 [Gordonia sp. X0973]|uniref:hypothetical protein n=1 Tax=Gordonia sp. X0973 TaxID=2742602 RepID=UPI000F52290D|nr:hypothetical protein [Gordonia sp. X0973]QKT08693.1 hypothetical protein HUN08_16875 [Gordonia sp. X0973]
MGGQASIGLVRRADKDLAVAEPRIVDESDVELTVEADGETVRLDGPDSARCGCAAFGICRHVIMVCLWLGRQAEATADEVVGPAVPPVGEPAAPSKAVLKRSADQAAMRADAAGLLADIVRTGTAHASPSMVERCRAAAISAQVADHYRLASQLRRIGDHLRRIVERTAGAGESHVVADLASTLALICSLDATPAGEELPERLLGSARTAYAKVPMLHLVGLGSYPWETSSGYRGLTTMFLDRDMQRFYSSTTARPVASSRGFDPVAAYPRGVVWPGLAAPERATGAAIDVARVRRNVAGRLSGGDDTLAQHEPLSSAELNAVLRPIRRWADFGHVGEPYELLEPRDENADWVVLAPVDAGESRFDEVEQRVEWPIVDEDGAVLRVRLRFSEISAHAVARLRGAVWEPESLVVGRLDRDVDGVSLMPISVIRPHLSCADHPVDVLFFDEAPHEARGLRVPRRRRGEPPVRTRERAATPVDDLLAWCERVIERGVGPARTGPTRSELESRHQVLRDAGFTVFPERLADETAVQVLRTYAIAEQVRRCARAVAVRG